MAPEHAETHGKRAPAPSVPYVLEAHGSWPQGHYARHVRTTRTNRRRTVAPRTLAVHRRLDPSRYDPKAADGANGGALFECGPSPAMVAIDRHENCWTVQDQRASVVKCWVDTCQARRAAVLCVRDTRTRPPAYRTYERRSSSLG